MNAKEIEKYIRENQLTSDECEGIYNALLEQNEVLFGMMSFGREMRNDMACSLSEYCGIDCHWGTEPDKTRAEVLEYLKNAGYKTEGYEKAARKAMKECKEILQREEMTSQNLIEENVGDIIAISASSATDEIEEWLKENGKTKLDCD